MKKWYFSMVLLPLFVACNFNPFPRMADFPKIDLERPTENWLGDPESLNLKATFKKSEGLQLSTMELSWRGEETPVLIGTADVDASNSIQVSIPRPPANVAANALDALAGFTTGVKLHELQVRAAGSTRLTHLEGDWNFGGLSTNNFYVYSPEDTTYVKLNQKVEHRPNEVYVSVKFKKGWNKLYQHFDAQYGRLLLTTSYKYNPALWESVLDGTRDTPVNY